MDDAGKLAHDHYLTEFKIYLTGAFSLGVALIIGIATRNIATGYETGGAITLIVLTDTLLLYLITIYYRRKLEGIRKGC